MNGPFMERKATEMSAEEQKKLYVRPAHFDLLYRNGTSCIFGERGSGKTTALRHLEYEINEEKKLNGIAVYYRFETAGMRSMYNSVMDEETNIENFIQILTAIFCKKIFERYELCCEVQDKVLMHIFDVLDVLVEKEFVQGTEETSGDLKKIFEKIRRRTFANIRNGKYELLFDYREIILSIAEIFQSQFGEDFKIYFLLDEYENLTELQQRIINSLIKDAPYQIIYKVCLRPEGFWTRRTLADREFLMESHDYEERDYINDIMGSDAERSNMLREICRIRLRKYFEDEGKEHGEQAENIDNYLEKQNVEAEVAALKDCDSYERELKEKIKISAGTVSDNEFEIIGGMVNLQIVDILLEKGISFTEILREFGTGSEKCHNWMHNYKMNALYIILEECKGAKSYGGLDMIAYLSNFNIRMVLAILDNAFSSVDLRNADLSSVEKKSLVSIKCQSEAIRKYSKLMVDQIDYIPYFGGEEKNMMNALGRVFHQMITEKKASKFEANNFTVSATPDLSKEDRKVIQEVLKMAVMWGLLIQTPENKVKSGTDYSYSGNLYVIHPIFSVHYRISYRRKQKIDISERVFKEILSPVSGASLRRLFPVGKDNNIEGQMSFA